MPRNVEIKARLRNGDLGRIRAVALARSTAAPETIRQRDTFYRVTTGRLKLREFADGSAELIAYERPDQTGPKASRYVVSPCAEPALLNEALTRSLGVRGVVEKQREVIHVGQTRVHLDDVARLGHFLELEVVLEESQSIAAGEAVAAEWMDRLGLDARTLVEGAYIDLLEAPDGASAS